MTRKLATLYVGVLVSLAFVLSPLAHADGTRRHKTRYYAAPEKSWEDAGRDDWREGCIRGPRTRGLGTQWIGEAGALDAAKKDWMERTRYDHGESYLDLSHAIGFVKRCGRTSIGEVAGQTLFRCEILARPCKAQFTKVEGQK